MIKVGQKRINRSNIIKSAKVRRGKEVKQEVINSKQNEVQTIKPNSCTINILKLNSPIKKIRSAILISK